MTSTPSSSEPVDFRTGAPVAGSLDVRWIHGSRGRRAPQDPPIQVHAYDEHTYLLRQSKSVHYEAPFMFLLFGNDRAILLDTGATADPALFPLRATVDRLVDAWLADHPRPAYELVVAHTHGHGDHVAADPQFAGRPLTTVVGTDVAAVRAFFGFGDAWPAEQVTFDLGGRVLDLIGAPGHQPAGVVFHDPWTGFLLTGDTVMPARLYAPEYAVFTETLDRLAAFAATHPITHVLGCHVEMKTKPGRDYPLGATYQPDERPLPLAPERLTAIRDAAHRAAARPGIHVSDDFIIYHLPSRSARARLIGRGLVGKGMTFFRRALR